MKYLHRYKIWESRSYQRMVYIVQYLKSVCSELTDCGVRWYITPSDDIAVKVLGLNLFSESDYSSLNRAFFIMINTKRLSPGNDSSWFIDLLYHIESFMDSQGFGLKINARSMDYGVSEFNSVEEFENDGDSYFGDIKIEFVKKPLNEDIKVPIKVGDTVLGGRSKNKKMVVKKIGKNAKGDITINNKPLLKFRLMKESNEYQGPNHIRDLLYDWIGDGRCETRGNDKFRSFSFNYKKNFDEAKEEIESWNIGGWTGYPVDFTSGVYSFYYDDLRIIAWDKSVEDFLIDKLEGCQKVHSDKWPFEVIIWKKEGKTLAAQESRNYNILINYKEIWSVLENYSMENDEIEAFIKIILKKHFNVTGFKPKEYVFKQH